MKKILFFCIAILAYNAVKAQAPQWKSGYFKELDNSYIETASGRAKSVDDARNKAATEIIKRRDMATGASATVVNGTVTVSGNVVVKSRILDEYVERNDYGEYTVYILAQTAKHPDNTLELVTVTDHYPFSARSFVPGMQQLYKGQKAKGIMFIAAEVACVGGIVVSEGLHTSNINLINSTHNAQQRAQYTDKANMWQNVRNGFIAATAAVYVWNVVDALAAKGARYVKQGSAQFALAPYTNGETVGFAMNVKF